MPWWLAHAREEVFMDALLRSLALPGAARGVETVWSGASAFILCLPTREAVR